MSGQNQQFKQRKKTAMDHAKLKLYGERIDGAKQAPSFAWYLTEDGNPRIDVYTGVDGDKDNGRIRAAMDIKVAMFVCELIKRAIDNDGPCRFYVENSNYTWYQGQRSEQPKVLSKTVVGKAEDGRVYITVIAKDRPTATFYFTSPYFHKSLDGDGSPMDKALESQLYAKGYVSIVEQLLATVSALTYKTPEPRQGGQNGQGGGNRGGQGGGWKQQGGQGGGNRGGSDNFDEDIPFN